MARDFIMTYKDFPQLSATNESQLVQSTLQWSLAHGLVMYPPNFQEFGASHAPITLFPTPFPRHLFQNALDVQQLFNLLYSTIVGKHKEWLLEIIGELAPFDSDFTGRIYSTYQKALELNNGKVRQPLSLGLFRSDYFINSTDESIKQIEFNTISVSFGGLSTKVGQLHNYLNESGAYDDSYSYKYYEQDSLAVSDSARLLAKGLADARAHYGDKSVVVFVVQAGERNVFDQRHIEYALLELGIKSYRFTLEEVRDKTTVRDARLYVSATMDEVAVVYYRSGYAPSDYESDPELTWGNRLYLEDTLAIKCPSLLTQLSGAKKVQQILTTEEQIRNILPDIGELDLRRLLSTFVNIYPLDNSPEGKTAKKLAFEQPHKYVLKPQREGGGNNIYKEDIPGFLKQLPEEEWGAYILMELINPPTHKNKIVRNGEVFHENIISELGVFGTVLFDEDTGDIKTNDTAGHLLRSKFSSSNEGGVAAGFGCVDNVYLY